MYDIIIVGAGPAGLTASVYARRADKTVLIIEKETFGGQITHSPKVENYPGFIEMSGNELGEKLIEQALHQGAEIELDTVLSVSKEEGTFTVKGENGEYQAKSVILATGSHHRKLGLDREDDFTGEGISYCAVCDGAFYKGQEVAVIGGGNSALQEALLLAKTSTKVTLVQNLDFLTGEKKLCEAVENTDNIEIILGHTVKSIEGEDTFEGIIVESSKGETTHLKVAAVFVCIGQQPENEPFKDIVAIDERGYVVSGESCIPEGASEGVFVAGDCRSKTIRQVATAVSDGAIAALSACRYLDGV